MNSRLMALFAALIAIGQPAMGSATQASTPETRPMNTPPSMSRPPAPTVKPVVHDGVRYEQDRTDERQGDQMGGYLAAVDAKSGTRLWRLKVYELPARGPGTPTGGGRHFRSMTLLPGGKALQIEDEAGVRYEVDLARRTVTLTSGAAPDAPRAPAPPKPKPE